MWVQIHSYSHNVSSGDDLDCFLKGQRGQSFYASYVMKGKSPYVALSLATRAPFTNRLAIASLLRTVWFSERRPRLFARVHFLWLNSLVGSRLQMFSRSYNQCYLRPALIWQHELVGVASELVMLRLFVFGTKRIANKGFSCDWAFPVLQYLRYTFVFYVFSRITWSGASLVAIAFPGCIVQHCYSFPLGWN